jgi:DNA polymerase elongation subunit (family B)
MKFYTNAQVSGNTILLKEFYNGKRKRYRVEYQPTLYVNGKPDSTWHTLTGEPVEPLKFESIKEAREFVKTNTDIPDYPLYGNTQFQYSFIADEYPEHEISYDLKDISIFTIDIETESESGFTQDAAEKTPERVNVITLKDFNKDEYHVFTFVDDGIYNKKNRFVPKTDNIIHYEYKSEMEMLLMFLKVWNKLDPDIVTGWSSRFFDIPYLYNRLVLLFGEKTAKKLSPWNQVNSETVNFMNRDHNCYAISGISQLDYIQIYRKNVLDPRENYKLDYIAKVELGEGKIDWREKYGTMKEFYKKDFQWFVEYNIQDVKLPDMLEAKLKLIELVVSVAYIAKVNYVDVLAQTRTWDMLIYNYLFQKNIVYPVKKIFIEKKEQFEGAYVKDPLPGMYEDICSFDVNSLYPSIMLLTNMGIETKQNKKFKLNPEDFLNKTEKYLEAIEYSKKNNLTLAANGILYDRKNYSFLTVLLNQILNGRKIARENIKIKKNELKNNTEENIKSKKQIELDISSLEVKQKSLKVLANSCYGCLGTPYFRWFDIDNAEAVTLTGKVIIQYIQNGINSFLNKLLNTNSDYVIAVDTDSNYITLKVLVDKVYKNKRPSDLNKITNFIDTVCKEKLEPEIDRLFSILTNEFFNGMIEKEPLLKMKREIIASKGIWGSKKHYILLVQDTEGFRHPESKLKIMGFDLAKSSLPQFTKDAMRKAVNIVMSGTQEQLADFIEETRLKFLKLPVEDVAFPRGVNNLEKWGDEENIYTKGTPKAVKGVLIHNECLERLGLLSKYQPITSSEKIKYVHLKIPNPIHSPVIAFNGKLPKEFGLHKYVDFNDMFEGTLIKPLEKILDPIGWSTEKIVDMEQFFI